MRRIRNVDLQPIAGVGDRLTRRFVTCIDGRLLGFSA
jgi:hypothetical protein